MREGTEGEGDAVEKSPGQSPPMRGAWLAARDDREKKIMKELHGGTAQRAETHGRSGPLCSERS